MVFLVVLPMPQALAGTAPAPPGRVLIVSMAGVTWEDVAAGRAPSRGVRLEPDPAANRTRLQYWRTMS